MSRTERLLDLIQILRRHRRPVSGAELAVELAVSLRTVYRDVQTLIATGAPIDGEAGIGFVLRPGFTLPPLMFSRDEIEAIVLGSGMVARAADPALAKAARNALAKIVAVLPAGRNDHASTSSLIAGPIRPAVVDRTELAPIRSAIRDEQKIWIAYHDKDSIPTERTIWPMCTFASDVVVRFADFPETHGKPPLEKFLTARFARLKNYRLQKQLRAVSGSVIVFSWDAQWEDGNDGRQMQGYGIELLTMRGEEIAKWEAAFNVWQKGDAPSLPIV